MTHKLKVLGTRGHDTLTWTPGQLSETEVEEKFNELVESGAMVYEKTGPKTGDQVKSFNPEAEEYVAVFPVAGG